MADGPQYTVPLRRRREERTDYGKRLQLLKSGRPRAVIRLSNNQAQVQLVTYHTAGDETVAAAVSEQLAEYGWDHHTGNIPAAYLTGFLAAKRAVANGVETAVVDFGVYTPEYRGREFAVVQGLQDGGLDVEADDAVFPAEDRVTGGHIADHMDADVETMFETTQQKIDAEVDA